MEEEAPPSPQPRLYKGRCFLSDGSFAFRDGPCRLRQRGKALLDVSVISLTSSQRTRKSKVREYGDLGTVPLRVVNAKANSGGQSARRPRGLLCVGLLAERRGAGPGRGRGPEDHQEWRHHEEDRDHRRDGGSRESESTASGGAGSECHGVAHHAKRHATCVRGPGAGRACGLCRPGGVSRAASAARRVSSLMASLIAGSRRRAERG